MDKPYLIPSSSGIHRLELPFSSESLSVHSSPLKTLRASFRQLIRANHSESVIAPIAGFDAIDFERARTTLRRLIFELEHSTKCARQFRGIHQIEIIQRDTLGSIVTTQTPSPIPNVIAIFESALEHWQKLHFLDFPPAVVEKWRAVQHTEARRWQRAIDLYSRGSTLRLIRQQLVKEFGDGRGDIKSWVNGEKVPWLFKNILRTPPRSKTFDTMCIEPPESGYLFGTLLTIAKSKRPAINLISQDRDAVEYFRTVSQSLLNEPVEVKTGKHNSGLACYSVILCHRELVNFARHETAGQQLVPWHLLKTEEHERQFARAILDFNAGVSFKEIGKKHYPVVVVTFTDRKKLADEVEILFCRLGIEGNASQEDSGRVVRIEFSGAKTIEGILRLGFNAGRKGNALNRLESACARVAREYTVDEYRQVQDLLGKKTAVRSIARLTGISRDAVKGWAKGSKPDSIVRRDRILSILAETASPEVVKYLVLSRNQDPAQARQIGRGKSLAEIRLQMPPDSEAKQPATEATFDAEVSLRLVERAVPLLDLSDTEKATIFHHIAMPGLNTTELSDNAKQLVANLSNAGGNINSIFTEVLNKMSGKMDLRVIQTLMLEFESMAANR